MEQANYQQGGAPVRRRGVSKVLIAVIAVVVLLGAFLFKSYNGFVRMEEDVNAAWGNVETQYQRRLDLIPNLVETVKGYAEHESETYKAIAELRSGYEKASTPEEYAEMDKQLDLAINVAVEAYPELKANENFQSLQDELAGTENRIAVARRDFNLVATDFNKKIRTFPNNVIAGIFGFERRPLFESQAGAENAPAVEF